MPDPTPAPAPAAPAPGANPQAEPVNKGLPVVPAAPAADPVATPPAATPATTVLTDPAAPDPAAGDPPPAEPKAGAWPDDWRERQAKAVDGKVNERVLERLKRYASPQAALDALIAAQDHIHKNKSVKALGPNPTPEQLAEYRTANEIPEKPDGYKIELQEGRVIGEADKPVIKQITERLHGTNALPQQVNDAVDIYFDVQESMIADLNQKDKTQRSESINALAQEYGQDLTGNLNAMRAYLQTMPAGIGEMLANARAPDGTLLFNNLNVLRYFAQQAVSANPVATLVGGDNAADAFSTEIAALRAEQSDPQSSYWKGPQAEAKQIRFQKLLEAEGKMKQRAA